MNQGELVKRFLDQRDVILAYIFALTRDYGVAEEVLQNVAVSILQQENRAASVEHFPAWLREVARHRVADCYRQHTRRLAHEQPSGTLADTTSLVFQENVGAPEENHWRMKSLLECLQRLTGRSREVIEGFYRDQQSLKELAARLSWQENSVRVALSRARKALADCTAVKRRALPIEQPMDAGRFDTLMDRYLSEAPTPAAEAELLQLFNGDAGLRRMFADRLLLELHLRKAYASVPVAIPLSPPSRRHWRTLRGWLVAAVLLLAVGLALWGLQDRKNESKAILANRVVAGEIRIDGTVVHELPEEKVFEVAGDAPAVIQLADGSQAELAPASRAVLRGNRPEFREVIELQGGAGKFQVTSANGQFRVETAAANVTVLGTEFSVKLQPRGKGEGRRGRTRGKLVLSVTVVRGSVKIEANGTRQVLTAGMSRAFGDQKREEYDD